MANTLMILARLRLGQLRYIDVYRFETLTEGPRWLACNKNGFACASCNTSASLSFQLWKLELSTTTSRTGRRRAAQGTYSQPPSVRS